MDKNILDKLLKITKERMESDDPAHGYSHIIRVISNAQKILTKEKGNPDIVLPAVIMHDLITYPKNDPRNKNSVKESAEEAEKILGEFVNYSKSNIQKVKKCILCASFSYGVKPQTLEEKITVDADLLEATGAISIMRTFTTGGKMGRPLYNVNDPFAEKRTPDDLSFSLDLFFTRLMKVEKKLNTKTARKIAKKRIEFLQKFLRQFKEEIN